MRARTNRKWWLIAGLSVAAVASFPLYYHYQQLQAESRWAHEIVVLPDGAEMVKVGGKSGLDHEVDFRLPPGKTPGRQLDWICDANRPPDAEWSRTAEFERQCVIRGKSIRYSVSGNYYRYTDECPECVGSAN